jgi:hypothetical protein
MNLPPRVRLRGFAPRVPNPIPRSHPPSATLPPSRVYPSPPARRPRFPLHTPPPLPHRRCTPPPLLHRRHPPPSSCVAARCLLSSSCAVADDPRRLRLLRPTPPSNSVRSTASSPSVKAHLQDLLELFLCFPAPAKPPVVDPLSPAMPIRTRAMAMGMGMGSSSCRPIASNRLARHKTSPASSHHRTPSPLTHSVDYKETLTPSRSRSCNT